MGACSRMRSSIRQASAPVPEGSRPPGASPPDLGEIMKQHPPEPRGRASGLFIASLSLALLGASGAGCSKDEERPPKTPAQPAHESAGLNRIDDSQAVAREDR